MTTSLLSLAARAYALVALADNRLSPFEAVRFSSFARADPTLVKEIDAGVDVDAVFRTACGEVKHALDLRHAAQVFMAVRGEESKQALMRAAQAALVADDVHVPQENAALALIAEALRLDSQRF